MAYTNPFATPAPETPIDPTPGVGATTQPSSGGDIFVPEGAPLGAAPGTVVPLTEEDDRVELEDANPLGIFSNAWADLKEIGGGLVTLASSAVSDAKNWAVDIFDDADHEYVMDNMFNGVFGLGEFQEGGSVILNDYQDRYGTETGLLGGNGGQLYEHPLSFISDALAVVTAGGAGAVKGAQAASKLGLAGDTAKLAYEASIAASKAEKAASLVAKASKSGNELALAKSSVLATEARSAASTAAMAAAESAATTSADDVGRIANLVKAIHGSTRRVWDDASQSVIVEGAAKNPTRRLLYQDRYLQLKAPTVDYWTGRAERAARLADLKTGRASIRYAEKANAYRSRVEDALAHGADHIMRDGYGRFKARKWVDTTVGMATGKSHKVVDTVEGAYVREFGGIDPDIASVEDLVNAKQGLDTNLTSDLIATPEGATLDATGKVRPGVSGARRSEDFVPDDSSLEPIAGNVRHADTAADRAVTELTKHGTLFDDVNRVIDDKTVTVERDLTRPGLSPEGVARYTEELDSAINGAPESVEQVGPRIFAVRSDVDGTLYLKLDDQGQVVAIRRVSPDGTVITESVRGLPHSDRMAPGLELGLTHWADAGIDTLDKAKAEVGKQTFTPSGANLNKLLVRDLARRTQPAAIDADAPRVRVPAVGTPERPEFDAALEAAKTSRVQVTQALRQIVGDRFKVTSRTTKGEEAIRASAELLEDSWHGVDDIEGYRMTSEDMGRVGTQREAIRAAEEATGGKVRRVENTMDTPAPDGSRMIRLVVEKPDGSPAEFQLMTPSAAVVHDASPTLRGLLKVQSVLMSRGQLAGDPALRFEKMLRLSQQLWEGVTDEYRAARGGPAAAEIRQRINRFRVQVFKELTDPLLGKGLTPDSAFDNAYLPLRIRSGARWNVDLNDGAGGWVGGTSPLDLDRALAEAGEMAPMYYPMMDAESLPARGDFMRRGGVTAQTAPKDQNLLRNTGKLFTDDTFSRDAQRVWRVRAAQTARMREHLDILYDTVATYGRVLEPGEDLPDGMVMFSPGLAKNMVSQYNGMMDALMNDPSGKGLGDLMKELEVDNAARLKQLLADGDQPVWAVPEHVAKRLKSHSGSALRELLGPGADFFFATPTSLWKTATLAGRPAWMVNNFISNVMFLKLQGGRFSDVIKQLDKRYLRDMRESFGEDARQQVEGEGLYATSKSTPRQWDESTGLGQAAGFMQRHVAQSRAGNWLANRAEWVQRMNSGMEDAFRRASYLKASERAVERASIHKAAGSFWTSKQKFSEAFQAGLDEQVWGEAITEMNKYMNDYATLSPLARNIVKPYFAPFWSFYRHAAKLLLTMPFEHPFKSRLFALMTEVDDERNRTMGIDPNLMPGWMRSDVLFTGMGDAGDYRAMSNGGMNPFNGVTEAPLNMVHPLFKVFIEQSTGRSTFTGQQFTDRDTIRAFPSDQQYSIGADGQATPVEKVAPSIFEHILQQIPQYELAKDVIAGGTTYDTSSLLDVLTNPGDQVVLDVKTGEPYKPRDIAYGLAKMFGYTESNYDVIALSEKELERRAAAVKLYLAREAAKEGTTPVTSQQAAGEFLSGTGG